MSWDALTSSVRRLAQSETKHSSKASIIGSMVVLAAISGVLVAAVAVPSTAIFASTANDLSGDITELPLQLDDSPNPQTTRLYASDGSLVAYFYKENRQDVPLKDINASMRRAIISIEDNRFYEHGALDLKGTLRALVNNASEGQTQGGSSITQQLVKLTLLQQAQTKEQRQAATAKSTARKIRELKLAITYEQDHTKDEILERYLNIAYFGDGAYGISAAAYHYFSVSPEKLTTLQSATLAGLVKNPVEFDPRVYPERALQRRNTVIAVMAAQGKITTAESKKLQAEPLGLKITTFPNGCVTSMASFSCDYVRRYLLADESLGATVAERQSALENGGLTIKSNIDIKMQKALNKAVKGAADPKDKALAAMALVEPGTGKVRGVAQSHPMGANKKKGESYINFTVPRQYGDSGGFPAGSTFKMFTVAAALKQGIPVSKSYGSPQTMVLRPGTFFDCSGGGTGEWKVSNSTGAGTFNMTTGTRRSVNTYFAQLERDAGLCNVVKAAEAMGIKVPYPTDDNPLNNQVPSFTLGITDVSPLDMAAAYATPASGGLYCKPNPVNEIIDRNGKTIKKYEPECTRVMSKEVAAQINEILAGLQRPGGFGFSAGTGLNIPSAAKTGTTQDNKSVWYAGYTPEISAAAMLAAADSKGRPITLVGQKVKGRFLSFGGVAGSGLAGPLWKAAMGTIQDLVSPTPFEAPPRAARVQRSFTNNDTTSNGDQDRNNGNRGRGNGNGNGNR
ncbi:hypothetical protein ASD11_13970 [Aeromicrobium sp. Root495]|uniref:transglycosylase domain-containing protein n=1 Tax=Aeromicrobium sp. Root495 TaxID=1736550 RepID=UPI0006F624A1|nr:transglycosylase domain-containing protein [Aeromicrobium sp. Root495]KQY60542.1 hypothetical protein ASD11_13970 [Aeromicrobium sp. Root495]